MVVKEELIVRHKYVIMSLSILCQGVKWYEENIDAPRVGRPNQ